MHCSCHNKGTFGFVLTLSSSFGFAFAFRFTLSFIMLFPGLRFGIGFWRCCRRLIMGELALVAILTVAQSVSSTRRFGLVPSLFCRWSGWSFGTFELLVWIVGVRAILSVFAFAFGPEMARLLAGIPLWSSLLTSARTRRCGAGAFAFASAFASRLDSSGTCCRRCCRRQVT